MIISNIADLKALARQRVPSPFFEYFQNAASDGLKKRANRRDLDALRFCQKVMSSVADRSFNVTMLGEKVAMPVGLAPTGLAGGIHVTKSPFWFQLYLMKDRGFTQSLMDRAAAAGCRVLVLTMDLHVEAQRNRDLKNGFGIPPNLTLGNVASVLSRPRWPQATSEPD